MFKVLIISNRNKSALDFNPLGNISKIANFTTEYFDQESNDVFDRLLGITTTTNVTIDVVEYGINHALNYNVIITDSPICHVNRLECASISINKIDHDNYKISKDATAICNMTRSERDKEIHVLIRHQYKLFLNKQYAGESIDDLRKQIAILIDDKKRLAKHIETLEAIINNVRTSVTATTLTQ